MGMQASTPPKVSGRVTQIRGLMPDTEWTVSSTRPTEVEASSGGGWRSWGRDAGATTLGRGSHG